LLAHWKMWLPFSLRVIRRCSISICMRHNAYWCSWRHEIHYQSRDAVINCAIFCQPLLSSGSQKIMDRKASFYLRFIFCQCSHKTLLKIMSTAAVRMVYAIIYLSWPKWPRGSQPNRTDPIHCPLILLSLAQHLAGLWTAWGSFFAGDAAGRSNEAFPIIKLPGCKSDWSHCVASLVLWIRGH